LENTIDVKKEIIYENNLKINEKMNNINENLSGKNENN
jgi:hypothetical protein